MKMSPDKVICFTSEQELSELQIYFERFHQIEFIASELSDCPFHLPISKWKERKDLDYKEMQRCFEIQYNKFLWPLQIKKELKKYDRVYWIDAGLSQEHLFMPYYVPEKGYFEIELFDDRMLKKLHSWSNEKCFLIGKYNENKFFWSQGIEGYSEYHIIGGLFGGVPDDVIRTCDIFVKLLNECIEKDLYMEEQIMTRMYYWNKELFNLIKFDDWIVREWHAREDKEVVVFYNLFE